MNVEVGQVYKRSNVCWSVRVVRVTEHAVHVQACKEVEAFQGYYGGYGTCSYSRNHFLQEHQLVQRSEKALVPSNKSLVRAGVQSM